ncbi:MAG: hypothetical protein SangKO_083230 [Sandaracinaceae bacterium]
MKPEPDEDEDLLPPLPPMGDDDDDALPDAQDLGLDELVEDLSGEEGVGLDDDTGFDDDAPLYALELPPEEEADEASEDLDAIPFEGLDEGEEYGWTEDTTSASDASWDPAEMDLPSLRPLGSDDGGEVGVDDAMDFVVVDEDSAMHLPPLDTTEAEEEEAGDDLQLDVVGMLDDIEDESHDAVPSPLDGVSVEWLGLRGGASSARPPYASGAQGVFWVGDCFEDPIGAGEATRRGGEGLEGEDVVSIASDSASEGARVVVSTRLGDVLVSSDGGERFDRVASFGHETAQDFHLHREAGTERLWGRTGGGALHASDDLGRTWKGPLLLKRVAAIVTPPTGGVMVLCAGKDVPAQLAWTEDGGGRWSAVDGPGLPSDGEMSLAYGDGYVAVACDADVAGPFLSSDAGKTWARVPGLPPTGPIALVKEEGGVSLYAAHFFEAGDRGVVVRHRPGGGEAGLVLDVAEEAERRGLGGDDDAEGEHRVLELSLSRQGDRTVLLVATGVGVFRVRVEPET